MWPTCINELSPLEYELKAEIPKFLRKAFNDQGILNDDEMFIPIRPVSILGQCSTAAYSDCPNMPEHHIENSQDDADDYFNHIGRYYWFDFDIVGLDGEALPLRMVFNEGDGDCNDGLWGAVWERDTEKLVANILSAGSDEAVVEAVSQKYIDKYESQEVWVPIIFERYDNGEKEDPIPCVLMTYANDRNLEEFIGLAIRLCCLCTREDTYRRLGYDS